MVEKQKVIEREGGPKDVLERVAKNTVPGSSNSEFYSTLDDVSDVVEEFIAQTNNWFEIIDVRAYRDNKIGIPCRYRWTIKRWVANDMDEWLYDRGWELLPHRKADSYDHNDNEMEARYRKEIMGYQAHANFYVEFTNDVFEALQEGHDIEPEEDIEDEIDHMEKIRERVRG